MRPHLRLAAAAAALAFVSPALVAQGLVNGGARATPGTAKRFQQQAQRVSGQGQQGQQAPGGAGTQGVVGGVSTGRGRQGGPPKPAPRGPSGRVMLMGATPSEKGV